MSVLNFWLNTSSNKQAVWLVDKSGLLKGSVFVNLESSEAKDILVKILREAFLRGASFEILVDVKDINTTKKSSMNLQVELDTVLTNMVETVRVQQKPIDTTVLAKAEALLSGLRARPIVQRATEVEEEFVTEPY